MKINTVNVIEVVDRGIGNKIISFVDDEKGNIEAEKLFKKMAIKNYCNKNNIKSYIEDGYYELGYYKLFLIHSI